VRAALPHSLVNLSVSNAEFAAAIHQIAVVEGGKTWVRFVLEGSVWKYVAALGQALRPALMPWKLRQ
jgi:hypothetical protein